VGSSPPAPGQGAVVCSSVCGRDPVGTACLHAHTAHLGTNANVARRSAFVTVIRF